MLHALVIFDTSHLEMSPLNLFAPGTESSLNNWMSTTADTSHDPIGPCGPLEQSVDSRRHSAIAAWSSALDFGAHPAVVNEVSDFRVMQNSWSGGSTWGLE